MKNKTIKKRRQTRAEKLEKLNAIFRQKRAMLNRDFEVICRRLNKDVYPSQLCAELRDEKTGNLLYTTLCSLVSLRLRYKKNCSSDAAIVSIAKKLDLYPEKELREKARTDAELDLLREKTKKTFKRLARKARIARKKQPVLSYAQLVFARNQQDFNLKPLKLRKTRKKAHVSLHFAALK